MGRSEGFNAEGAEVGPLRTRRGARVGWEELSGSKRIPHFADFVRNDVLFL
jgi:hypothetical protein